MSLSIKLHDSPSDLIPDYTVTGLVRWSLDQVPKTVLIRLIWFTEGAGERDIYEADTQWATHLTATGVRSFRLRIPTKPYSFRGRLVSVHWAIELIINDGEHVERLDIVVSPWNDILELEHLPKESNLLHW